MLIDLDAESLAWEDDTWTLTVGDQWREVILDHTEINEVVWPFAIWDATDSWEVPGLEFLQDVEDVTPLNVDLNIEVASTDWAWWQDAEPNHRLDGTAEGVVRRQFDEVHGEVTEVGSEALSWAGEELRGYYGL